MFGNRTAKQQEQEEDVVIENSITEIDSNCFNGLHINKLILPSSLQSIKPNAFYSCTINEIQVSFPFTQLQYHKGCFNCCTIINQSPLELSQECFENDQEEYYILENFKNERLLLN